MWVQSETTKDTLMHPHEYEALKAGSLEPMAVRLPAATRASGLSRSEIYRRAAWPEGRPGRIVLLKCGKSTLVDMASLRAAVASLQKANIRAKLVA
jgi:hypothetical protein